MLTTGEAAEFHTLFQNTRSDIISSLDSSPTAKPAEELNDIASRVANLRKSVESISDGLAKYDRAKYESQLVELEQKLSGLRKKAKPASKFSFTNNKTKKSTSGPSGGTFTPPPASAPAPALDASSTTTTSQNEIPPVPIPMNDKKANGDISGSSIFTYTISGRSQSYIQSPISNTFIASTTSSGESPPAAAATTQNQTYTLSLDHLENCIIDLYPHPRTNSTSEADLSESTYTLTAIHAHQLKRCIVLCPIIKGSAMFSNCSNCIIIVGAQQFRMHSSSNTSILLNVPSLPVIEHCSSLRFGEYPLDLLDSTEQIESNHSLVQDFDWVRGGHSPNWSILPPSEAVDLGRRILSELRRLPEQYPRHNDRGQVDEILDRLLSTS